MHETDYLIVGAGIAGLSIAECLLLRHQKIVILNQTLPGAASIVSSGLINPITGKRFVKSWNFNPVEKAFIDFYKNLELRLNIDFLFETQLIEELISPEEENQWLSRTVDPEYAEYIGELTTQTILGYQYSKHLSYGNIKKVYRIAVEELLTTWIASFKKMKILKEEIFDYTKVELKSNSLNWNDWVIRKGIIFSEGYRVIYNPFFNWLPHFPLKGECCQFYSLDLSEEFIYKSGYAIIPQGNHTFWCGSNFELEDLKLSHTETEIIKQANFIASKLNANYTVTSNSYGIRPAIRDRRPVIGVHPMDPRFILFSGLGTKGFSLAPYCAHILAESLVADKTIPKSIGIERFIPKFYPNKG